MNARPLIIYDQDCSLCTRFKSGLLHFSSLKEENFIPLQDERVYTEFALLGLTQEECMKQVHLIDEENKVYGGPQVVEYLLPIIPAVSKLAWLLDSDQIRKATEVFYNSVSSLRKTISPSCRACSMKS